MGMWGRKGFKVFLTNTRGEKRLSSSQIFRNGYFKMQDDRRGLYRQDKKSDNFSSG